MIGKHLCRVNKECTPVRNDEITCVGSRQFLHILIRFNICKTELRNQDFKVETMLHKYDMCYCGQHFYI